jgi:alpha-1,2-mannosyltransferase
VLNVKDWRLYGVVLACPPVVVAWQTANLTPLLVLGVALVWRHRDRPLVAGSITAALVSLKLVTWPLGLWLLATRRYRAAGSAVAVGIAINLAAWSVLGFGEIGAFVHLSVRVTDALSRTGYGLISLATHAGASRSLGEVAEALLSVALAIPCLLAGRRGRDLESLALCTVLMLAASPLVWTHYLAFLVVPLAIFAPRLSWTWALLFLLLLCPSDGATTWDVILAWTIVTLILYAMTRPARPADKPARPRAVSRFALGSGPE